MEANCWNYLCSQPLSAFRIVYSRSNRAWGAGSQHCQGPSPCIYHPVSPIGALFFRFDARPPWHLAKLPTNYLLTFWNPVCKLCTLRRWELSRPRWFLPCIFRGLLLAGTDDGSVFWSQRASSSENT